MARGWQESAGASYNPLHYPSPLSKLNCKFLSHYNSTLLIILKSIQEILNKISEDFLPRLASKADDLTYKGNYGVVILATPSFAPWLEDNAGFIPKVLESMNLSSNAAVVSACVDGLPEGMQFFFYNYFLIPKKST